MQKRFYDYLHSLKKKQHINQDVLSIVLDRVMSNPRFSKQEGIPHHFGSFFLPVDKKSKLIYLVHHIKAEDWIPPGGHVDAGELPMDTLKREFTEELSHVLTEKDEIELFDVSVKHLSDMRPECSVHYDIWHLVYAKKKAFNFDRREFYDAGWFSLEEGIDKIQKNPNYKKIVEKLKEHI